jgi:hypothetical protein
MKTQDRGMARAASSMRTDDMRWAAAERRRRSASDDTNRRQQPVESRLSGFATSVLRRMAGSIGA